MGWSIGAMAVASRLPFVRSLQERSYERALSVTGEGPEGWPADGVCRTVAVAKDAHGGQLAQVDVVGPTDAYRLSADLLAWAAYRAGDFAAAGEWLKRAPAGSSMTLWIRAKLLMRAGKLAEAEASLREALRIRPDYAEAHNNLGGALRDQGRPAEAEAALRAAGVTGFVFAGGDALATLQDAYRRMEQP